MVRYIKTLNLFWATSIASQLEYKVNFCIEFVAMFATLSGSIFILSIFFDNGLSIGSWTWETALIIQGVYTFLDGLTNTFLRPNLTEIVNYVREGTLDYVLLKPIDSQFWISTKKFAISGLPEMFLGLFIIIYAVNKIQISITISNLIIFIALIINAAIILYSLWFVVAATSIWFVKTWNATEVLRALLAAGRYPVSAYPITVQLFFTLVLPVAFLTTIPAEAILGTITLGSVSLSLLFSILFFYLSRSFWNYALKFYTSASS